MMHLLQVFYSAYEPAHVAQSLNGLYPKLQYFVLLSDWFRDFVLYMDCFSPLYLNRIVAIRSSAVKIRFNIVL